MADWKLKLPWFYYKVWLADCAVWGCPTWFLAFCRWCNSVCFIRTWPLKPQPPVLKPYFSRLRVYLFIYLNKIWWNVCMMVDQTENSDVMINDSGSNRPWWHSIILLTKASGFVNPLQNLNKVSFFLLYIYSPLNYFFSETLMYIRKTE